LSPEKYRAELWKLFNRVPADTATFSLLSAALIAARDWEGAGAAVRQHQAAGGTADPGELLLVQGMVAAMTGDFTGAAAAFRAAETSVKDGRARYDLALVLLSRGNTHAAIQELGAAADEYGARGDPAHQGPVLSRIETLMGEARMLEGDEAGAHGALARALALEPGNMRAGLLLRKLEAGGQ
jgi:tetratricopeptide (TPR) repeat protein